MKWFEAITVHIAVFMVKLALCYGFKRLTFAHQAFVELVFLPTVDLMALFQPATWARASKFVDNNRSLLGPVTKVN